MHKTRLMKALAAQDEWSPLDVLSCAFDEMSQDQRWDVCSKQSETRVPLLCEDGLIVSRHLPPGHPVAA
jgi:hypothetical protein